MTRKLRIGVSSKSTGFCYFYRIKWPLETLQKNGLIETMGVDWSNSVFRENQGKYMAELLEWADILLLQYGNPQDVLIRYNDLVLKERLPKLGK